MKEIFCTKCADITEHDGSVDNNHEFVFVCKECDHFVKFPPVDKDTLEELIAQEETINKPLAEARKAQAAQEAVLQEVLG